MPIVGEIWKDIPGYEGLYQASNMGRVRSLPRWRSSRRGRYFVSMKILKPFQRRDGYLEVGLHKNGGQKAHRVSKLILLAFVGPPPEGYETRHFPDPNPSNNRLCNLSWSNHTDNIRDRFIHGTHSMGENNGEAKLTEEKVLLLRRMGEEDFNKYQNIRVSRGRAYPYGKNIRLAKRLFDETGKSISVTMVGYILRMDSWKHLA